MQDSVNDNFIRFHFKKNSVIANSQSIAGLKLHETLDVAAQIISRQSQFLDNPFLLLSLKIAEIFLSTRPKLNLVFHAVAAPTRDRRSITQDLFSLRGAGQGILASCDCRRARVLQLLGLNRVELDIFREFWWKVLLLVDGVHRAYVHAGHAINAIIRVNDHLVVQFVEAGHGTHLHTVGELASGTFVGHDVGHGICWLRTAKKAAVDASSNW